LWLTLLEAWNKILLSTLTTGKVFVWRSDIWETKSLQNMEMVMVTAILAALLMKQGTGLHVPGESNILFSIRTPQPLHNISDFYRSRGFDKPGLNKQTATQPDTKPAPSSSQNLPPAPKTTAPTALPPIPPSTTGWKGNGSGRGGRGGGGAEVVVEVTDPQ
jgi:hypothetical protein